jgi:hypothetical protein
MRSGCFAAKHGSGDFRNQYGSRARLMGLTDDRLAGVTDRAWWLHWCAWATERRRAVPGHSVRRAPGLEALDMHEQVYEVVPREHSILDVPWATRMCGRRRSCSIPRALRTCPFASPRRLDAESSADSAGLSQASAPQLRLHFR